MFLFLNDARNETIFHFVKVKLFYSKLFICIRVCIIHVYVTIKNNQFSAPIYSFSNIVIVIIIITMRYVKRFFLYIKKTIMDNSLINDFLTEYHNSKNIKHKYREIIGPINTEK